MKILILSNLYPPFYVGGYELFCRSTVEGLRSRGHSVTVLTSDHGVSNTSSPPIETQVIRVLRIHGTLGHPFVGIFRLRALELHNNQELVSTLQQVKPDLVYVWNLSGLSKSMLFTLQKLGVPTVFCVCDHWIIRSQQSDVWLDWWNREKARLRGRCLRTFWTLIGYRRVCDKFAATNPARYLQFPRIHFCSRALRDLTVAAGFNVNHGKVIHCSVNTKKFTGQAFRSKPLRRLLYAGRLHEDKGVMTALRAMVLLHKKFAGTLSIYGQGDADYEKKLISFVRENELPVVFNGALNPDKMQEVYRAHDALLFTSEWAEPFALTPLEAMSSGLPVISTMTGGSMELFRHGENALTYSAGNAEDLAQRILELNSNNSRRQKIARTGQQEVRARFAEPLIVSQVEDYLHQTIQHWCPLSGVSKASAEQQYLPVNIQG